MKRSAWMSRAVVAVLMIGVVLALPIIVLAHVPRTIAGKYDVEVGWDKEPTYAAERNAASIQINRIGTEDGVDGVEKTLKVNIASGGNTPKEYILRATNKKGYYLADFTPPQAGSYIFTFVGTIEETAVNERFESGPGRFDDAIVNPNRPAPAETPIGNRTAFRILLIVAASAIVAFATVLTIALRRRQKSRR
ncbi:MAG: hypothetical protein ABI947_18020 [Chloroflexota bacterium]